MKVKKLVKFTIPNNANEKYPINEKIVNKLNTNSWFDMQGQQTMCCEELSDKTILRCKQIIIKPTIEQRKILVEWFSIYRYVYNQTILYIRTNKLESFYTLRKLIKPAFNQEIKQRINACKIPVHTIDNAIKDAINAYKTSFSLHKGKKTFRIRYKKENANQIITLESSAFSKKINTFSQKLGVISTSEPLGKPTHDCKLSYRSGDMILYVPIDKNITDCMREVDCCSLDPGLRTFQTVYCNNGETYEIGTNAVDKLGPLHDKLKQTNTKSKYKKRIRDKISHLVDDLHWKTASVLCKLSDNILIGNMSTIGVLQGNLQSKTKCLLQTLSHYTFRQRLKAKCEEYGVEFKEVDESYTSKTCGCCGEINATLGSSKVFKCVCGFIIDRDINGARNIMIKHLQ